MPSGQGHSGKSHSERGDFVGWAIARRSEGQRDPERERLAEELFSLAGAGPVTEAHVTDFVKRKRQGLSGARTVILAHEVGEDVLAWQRERATATAEDTSTMPSGWLPPRLPQEAARYLYDLDTSSDREGVDEVSADEDGADEGDGADSGDHGDHLDSGIRSGDPLDRVGRKAEKVS